jgi:hypothetical protein
MSPARLGHRSAEIHLFVLWAAALAHADAIYDDLQQHFDLVDSVRVHWRPEAFEENLLRLYGSSLAQRTEKMASVGVDPFHVLVVRDRAPAYGPRRRSWGIGPANVHTYDAKARYRQWAGGGSRVHATLDVREAERDVFMLLGRRLDELVDAPAVPWMREPYRESNDDIVGAPHWDSLRQLLTALEVCVPHVVLWRRPRTSRGEVLTLLVDERERAATVAAGWGGLGASRSVECSAAGERVVLDLRETGDGTLDREWQRAVLRHPLRRGDGSLAPGADDDGYIRLHELVTDARDRDPEVEEIRPALPDSLPPGDYADPTFARAVLEEFMLRTGYGYATPAAGGIRPSPAVLGRRSRFRHLVRRRAL